MIEYAALVEAFKKQFTVPFNNDYVIDELAGDVNLFAGHPHVTFANISSTLDTKRVYRTFADGEAIRKGEILSFEDKYYKANESLSENTTIAQLTETTLEKEYVLTLFDETVQELFRTWKSKNKLIGWGSDIETHNKSVYTYDQKELNDTATYEIALYTIPHTDTRVGLKEIIVYSRSETTQTPISVNGVDYPTDLVVGVNRIPINKVFSDDLVEISVVNDSFLVEQPSCSGGQYVNQVEYIDDTEVNKRAFELSFNYYCDFSEYIERSADDFILAIQFLFAIKFLNMIANNPHAEINRNEANVSQDDVTYQLDGSVNTKGYTLKNLYLNALKGISPSILPNNGICSACKNRKYAWGTV